MEYTFSQDNKRNKAFEQLMMGKPILSDVVKVCHQLMKDAKCHRHFFGENSWWHCFWGTSDLLPTTQYLVLYGAGLTKDYAQHKDTVLSEQQMHNIISIIEKRISERIPVEYITHECEYLGHTFYVNENVLVPRSLMNTRFEDFVANTHWTNYKVLDLCTGSGCIGISLALLNPKITVDCADISPKALEVTNINIQRFNLSDRVKTIESDLFTHIHDQYDLIISNPPYVTQDEYQGGPQEMKNEPKIALECDDDGLAIVERMIVDAPTHLNPQGSMIVEVGMPAAKRLKRRHPKRFHWMHPKPALGKADFLDWVTWGRDCIFEMKK